MCYRGCRQRCRGWGPEVSGLQVSQGVANQHGLQKQADAQNRKGSGNRSDPGRLVLLHYPRHPATPPRFRLSCVHLPHYHPVKLENITFRDCAAEISYVPATLASRLMKVAGNPVAGKKYIKQFAKNTFY